MKPIVIHIEANRRARPAKTSVPSAPPSENISPPLIPALLDMPASLRSFGVQVLPKKYAMLTRPKTMHVVARAQDFR
ncbi:Uncharacterised protein [Mycobacteroides abscessus subsp. abscessus]|nr:Uncharacterised protein [Mycobacteroides abscessus subsp. abscessus]